mmetsp:Transcript_13401/g.31720  ORF Transcript_13401/g.31720 Transcript_13401/m.31720 type:complete len:206 (-) Transcript_13401:6148-6765(-)
MFASHAQPIMRSLRRRVEHVTSARMVASPMPNRLRVSLVPTLRSQLVLVTPVPLAGCPLSPRDLNALNGVGMGSGLHPNLVTLKEKSVVRTLMASVSFQKGISVQEPWVANPLVRHFAGTEFRCLQKRAMMGMRTTAMAAARLAQWKPGMNARCLRTSGQVVKKGAGTVTKQQMRRAMTTISRVVMVVRFRALSKPGTPAPPVVG